MQYNFDLSKGPIKIEWMMGAETNICYNALDKQVDNGHGDKVAFYWVGNDPNDKGSITYAQLLAEVCKFANALEGRGVKPGDRVALYMPMITELVVAMLACARIGAVHSIVFGGYSADSLATRILDAGARVLITADGVYRGTKLIKLLEIANSAMSKAAEQGCAVKTHICVSHLGRLHTPGDLTKHKESVEAGWVTGRDEWWHAVMKTSNAEHSAVMMDSEAPLFMLYTSGSTGKPKGVLHSTAGYMLYAATTFKYSFDAQLDDVYWCTADIGWITGHSYVTYGPLLNAASSVLFEGTPFYPDHKRCWQIIAEHRVSKFYTAPTAIRSLMKFGQEQVEGFDLTCLKVLGTVGEPINPEAWQWYHKVGPVLQQKQCLYSFCTNCLTQVVLLGCWRFSMQHLRHLLADGDRVRVRSHLLQNATGLMLTTCLIPHLPTWLTTPPCRGHILTPLPGCTPAKPGSVGTTIHFYCHWLLFSILSISFN